MFVVNATATGQKIAGKRKQRSVFKAAAELSRLWSDTVVLKEEIFWRHYRRRRSRPVLLMGTHLASNVCKSIKCYKWAESFGTIRAAQQCKCDWHRQQQLYFRCLSNHCCLEFGAEWPNYLTSLTGGVLASICAFTEPFCSENWDEAQVGKIRLSDQESCV